MTIEVRSQEESVFEEAVSYLHEQGCQLIQDSRRAMNDGTAAFPPQVGIGYEAFWLRDFAYMLEGCPDALSRDELLDSVRVFLDARREDGSCVDCVKFDGTPVYRPGYDTMGENPVADGSPFTVAVVFLTWQYLQKDFPLTDETLNQLIQAMKVVPRHSETGLVWIDPKKEWDRCPYGFTDSVRKTGNVLFCSLLYVEASERMAIMLHSKGRETEADEFLQEKERMIQSINQVFWDEETGLYRATSACCKEHDVWGSAFAVYLGVTDAHRRSTIANWFKKHYNEVVLCGQVRSLPAGVWWEKACNPETYQNGGYWGTASGWVIYTLAQTDRELAAQMTRELIHDYQNNGIYEWILADKSGTVSHRATIKYIASATNPIAGIRKLLAKQPKDEKELKQ